VLLAVPPPPTAPTDEAQRRKRAGTGEIELAVVAGRTAVISRRATSPLKLLTPRGFDDGAARVVASTYGGGLLAGDDVRLSVTAGPGTRAALTTQASTKVYRSGAAGLTSRQSLDATLADGATLAVAPDPVSCFAGARFEQRQTFDLAAGASLLLIDWLTSGRAARGERWAFDRCRTETSVRVDGRLVARDALLLDPADGPVGAAHRMGRFDCLATALLIGPAMADAAARAIGAVGSVRLAKRAPLIAAASPIVGGAVIRVIGVGAEPVGRFLRSLLAPAFAASGGDPWLRKW
jgi:urease accessory protein